MTTPSRTHAVIIPSYNTGAKVYETVREARAQWAPVWVVVDGSDDGTTDGLRAMAAQDTQLHLIVLPENRGKGAAVLTGLLAAHAAGARIVATLAKQLAQRGSGRGLISICAAGVPSLPMSIVVPFGLAAATDVW